jgi:hypothetical protein
MPNHMRRIATVWSPIVYWVLAITILLGMSDGKDAGYIALRFAFGWFLIAPLTTLQLFARSEKWLKRIRILIKPIFVGLLLSNILALFVFALMVIKMRSMGV